MVYLYLAGQYAFVADAQKDILESIDAYRSEGILLPKPTLEEIAYYDSLSAPIGDPPYVAFNPTDDLTIEVGDEAYAMFRRHIAGVLQNPRGPLYLLIDNLLVKILVPERAAHGIQLVDWDRVECANLVPAGHYVKVSDWKKQH